ncbi:MAG TPA: hypothetical protein VF172_10300 [Nitrososphaera sp.]|jgi:hypothetical protein
MASKIFLVGIVAGLAAAMGLAGLFSAISTQSAAQMMGGNRMGMMGNNMMITTDNTQQVPWHWANKASFGSGGISYLENVQITGISISSDKQVTVNLRYSGNGTTPNVVVVASTGSMGMMGGYGGMGMMGSHMPMMGYPMFRGQAPVWNDTQWQEWHSQMAQWHNQMSNQSWNNRTMNPNIMGMGWQQQSLLTGSTALESGWTSNATVRITLVGDGSAYDTNNVSVMVYPLTS